MTYLPFPSPERIAKTQRGCSRATYEANAD